METDEKIDYYLLTLMHKQANEISEFLPVNHCLKIPYLILAQSCLHIMKENYGFDPLTEKLATGKSGLKLRILRGKK